MSTDFQLEQEIVVKPPTNKVNRSSLRWLIRQKLEARNQWPLTDLVAELSAGQGWASYIYRRLAKLNGHDLEIRKMGKINWVLALNPSAHLVTQPRETTVSVKIIVHRNKKVTIQYPRTAPKPKFSTTATLTFLSH